ncbi:NACHT domain-containing protein [Thelonectria olida]|uniref:NACHT domain-containing protein n=1 Tax=Thelonectria olida TaxID=1576542 RepID=A0A9P8VSZ8_9HYPO|nr:NACHT domain-containing protein [Thelonectria olida]
MSTISNTVDNLTADGNAHIHVGNNIYGTEDHCLADLRSTDPRHDKGDPGKGKTILLCGIINELKKQTANLMSYFFCQGADSRINNATAKKYDYARKDLFVDVNAWVALSEIFANILQDPNLKSTFLIIDALDECASDLPKLLNLIVEKSSESPHVKWVVSSRNWPNIEEQLETAGQKVRLCLELNEKSISAAVSIYIRQKHHLFSNANDTFLWVALACQDLEKIPRRNTLAKLKAFPPGLDSLYERMIEQIRKTDDSDLSMRILALLTIVYRPISLHELTSFVDMLEGMADDVDSLVEIIGLCRSFLTLRDRTIYFIHQSAKDFLLTRASSEIFSGLDHYTIFSRSLLVMSRSLGRDMYDLHHPGASIDDVRQPKPDPLAPARYSCFYWVDHLRDAISHGTSRPIDDLHDGTVYKFLSKKYLYWLEALSLLRGMPEGVVATTKLETLLEESDKSRLFDLIRDARRFILSHGWAIGNAPLQAYASALIFSPRQSIARKLFEGEEPNWIVTKPAMAEDWDACQATLEGHGNEVDSVAFSADGQRLASASRDRTVKIRDATTGHCQATLEGHMPPNTICFDQTGARLLTDAGAFELTVPSPSPSPPAASSPPHHPLQRRGYGISADDVWITYQGRNLLWLPSEYRPATLAIAASTVALGCRSGRVLLFRFTGSAPR